MQCLTIENILRHAVATLKQAASPLRNRHFTTHAQAFVSSAHRATARQTIFRQRLQASLLFNTVHARSYWLDLGNTSYRAFALVLYFRIPPIFTTENKQYESSRYIGVSHSMLVGSRPLGGSLKIDKQLNGCTPIFILMKPSWQFRSRQSKWKCSVARLISIS